MFTLKPNCSALCKIVEITSGKRWQISFFQDDTMRNQLKFKPVVLHEEYNLPHNPVDTLSIDNNFLETDMAQGMIFEGKRSKLFQNWTKTVNPGNTYVEKISAGIQWYMTDTKDFISIVNFKLKTKNGNLVSFNGKTITFQISTKEI